jgi:hypothetical protein
MREKNIIIHGVNEIDSSEPSVRKQNDTKFVTNLAEFLDNDEICINVQTCSDLFDFATTLIIFLAHRGPLTM